MTNLTVGGLFLEAPDEHASGGMKTASDKLNFNVIELNISPVTLLSF